MSCFTIAFQATKRSVRTSAGFRSCSPIFLFIRDWLRLARKCRVSRTGTCSGDGALFSWVTVHIWGWVRELEKCRKLSSILDITLVIINNRKHCRRVASWVPLSVITLSLPPWCTESRHLPRCDVVYVFSHSDSYNLWKKKFQLPEKYPSTTRKFWHMFALVMFSLSSLLSPSTTRCPWLYFFHIPSSFPNELVFLDQETVNRAQIRLALST